MEIETIIQSIVFPALLVMYRAIRKLEIETIKLKMELRTLQKNKNEIL